MSTAFVVGVTGGIGSGKSLVCAMFEALGVPVIDADIAARKVVEPGTPGLARVVEAFGTGVLDAEGRLDRSQLRRIVFRAPADRRRLEAILHPLIRDQIRGQLARVTSAYCVLCIPLLAESAGGHPVDRILVVDCPPEIQIPRVMQRDELTEDEVKAIIATQAHREQRLALADDVIYNAGDVDALRATVAGLHTRYLELAAAAAAKEH